MQLLVNGGAGHFIFHFHRRLIAIREFKVNCGALD